MPANVTDVLGRGNDREHVSMLEMSRDFLETECLRVATTLLGYGHLEVKRIARGDFRDSRPIGASKEVGVLPPIAECGRLLRPSREETASGARPCGQDGIVEPSCYWFVFDPGRPSRLTT